MAEVNGTNDSDVLYGTSGDDVVSAGNGYDTIYGSSGRDTVDGGLLGDTLYFGFFPAFPDRSPGLSLVTGDRTITVTGSQVTDSAGQIATSFTSIETISFGTSGGGFASGTTTIDASAFSPVNPGNGSERLTVSAFDVGTYSSQVLNVTGTAQDDGIFVGLGNHVLNGGTGRDRLGIFGAGNMTLLENAGVITAIGNGRTTIARDFELVRLGTTTGGVINAYDLKIDITFDASISGTYFGGSGNDLFDNSYSNTPTTYAGIFVGGAGADTYRYSSFGGNLNQDRILDFAADDRIDLGFWTKNTTFIGNAAFTGVALQVRYEIVGNTTQVQVDNDGDGVGDATLFIENGPFRLVETALGSDVLRIAGANEATAGNDTLTGSDGNDFFNALGGNDTIYGRGGNDDLRGGDGDDTIDGGAGNDFIYGQAGNDTIYGGDGDDFIRTSSGIDFIDGGAGIDRISFFNSANDIAPTQGVIADLGRGLLLNDGYGNREQIVNIEGLGGTLPFADILRGDDKANALLGGQGDRLYGMGGDDQLLMGGMLGSILDGGDGIDSVSLITSRDVFTSNGGVASEIATMGVVIDLSRGTVLNDGFGNGGKMINVENVYAFSEFDSRITGSSANNSLTSGVGDDRLSGLAGDDMLIGGLGQDYLIGGEGADTFVFSGFAVEDSDLDGVLEVGAGSSAATVNAADRIMDFNAQQGDRIDLSRVDAIGLSDGSSPLDQALTWRGTSRFTGAAGEARYQVKNGATYIYLEVNGEAGADMVIRLDGVHALSASDFIL